MSMTSPTPRTRGAHHVGLSVPDLAAARLLFEDALGFEIEFAPEPLGEAPTRHMMCAIPCGIRLELIAPVAG